MIILHDKEYEHLQQFHEAMSSALEDKLAAERKLLPKVYYLCRMRQTDDVHFLTWYLSFFIFFFFFYLFVDILLTSYFLL